MDLLQWPFVRQTYPGIDNPLFVDDIAAANQGALAGLMALSGLEAADFAIISGMEYNAPVGGPNIFNPGIFFLNGVFYVLTGITTEGLYLAPNIQSQLSEPFNDGNARSIYNVQGGMTANAAIPGTTSPQLMGNMNAYRVGNKYLSGAIVSLLATQAALGDAAFLDVGTTINTVAAGNDPRMPYTQMQLDAKYAQIANVIIKGTATAYTPTAPNDPTNKAYVDSTSAQRRAAGLLVVGNVGGGGTQITVSFGFTMPDDNYIIMLTVQSLSSDGGNDVVYAPMWRNASTVSFDIYLREPVGNTQNINVGWIVFGL